jgi:hypothetical protein
MNRSSLRHEARADRTNLIEMPSLDGMGNEPPHAAKVSGRPVSGCDLSSTCSSYRLPSSTFAVLLMGSA